VSTRTDGSVERYLRDLDRALRDLPAARRREIVEEIHGHIDEARSQGGVQSDADVRALLERLGDPEEIAADARERFGIQPARPGALEVIALIMLPVGALILPLAGWLVGVVCLWVSPRWTARDKLIGTLIFPGGMLFPIAVGLLATGVASTTCVSPSAGFDQCSGPGVFVRVVLIVALALAFVLPIVVDVYLYRRLQRGAASKPGDAD